MKHSHLIYAAALTIALAGLSGCNSQKKAEEKKEWPLAYALPSRYEAAGDSVVRASDNRTEQLSDSVSVLIVPGSLSFKCSDSQLSLIFNHFMHGGSVVVTDPKSGEWLHLWRNMVMHYDSLKASGSLPANLDDKAIEGLENMRLEMTDAEGYDGTEPGMGFETPIAKLIGFRGNDIYYQVTKVNTGNLLKWETGTPSTDNTLLEKY